jgi:hypothetical protein
VFSQTTGQKKSPTFQNCPSQPHADQKFLQNEIVSQKWLKKCKKTFVFAVLASQAQPLLYETPTPTANPVIIEHAGHADLRTHRPGRLLVGSYFVYF